ncbi:MAG: NADH:flavin oxidoreductase/NADH oxidase family protein [Pseudomonadota bacterium]
MTVDFEAPLTLPCGAVIENRFGKSAMTEGLADPDNCASDELIHLYGQWSDGGCGLLISGNVFVDRRYLERPGNVAVDNNGGLDKLAAFAEAGKRSGNHFWMQISHAGRASPALCCEQPVAPSAIPLELPAEHFHAPRAMEHDEIVGVIDRYEITAEAAKDAGFTGVQIHSAHGNLLSEFLSPRTNKRDDQWGGTLENRASLLLQIFDRVRKVVGPDYPISVKLNAADFQKGGFSHEESLTVARWLAERGVDLLEVSGGNFEQPVPVLGAKMPSSGGFVRESTIKREAYFMRYAEDARRTVPCPLMITGGFRTRAGMAAALDAKVLDIIGLGRPLCTDAHAVTKLLNGDIEVFPDYENQLDPVTPDQLGPDAGADDALAANFFGYLGWFCLNLQAIARGEKPNTSMTMLEAAMAYVEGEQATAARWHSVWPST